LIEPDLTIAVGFPMAIGLGLLYGLGPCLATCLPFLAPVYLSRGERLGKSWEVMLPVSLGRLTVYGFMGVVSGWAGSQLQVKFSPWLVHLVVGLAALLVGGHIIARSKFRSSGCQTTTCEKGQAVTFFSKRSASPKPILPGGLYLMGAGMALTPCVPMSAVLVSAGMTASPIEGGLLGFLFGLGAIVGPALVIGIGVAYFGQQLRLQLGQFLPKLEMLSGLLLVAVGLRQLVTI
jgi:thiol:disulfide interchange protein DsbD